MSYDPWRLIVWLYDVYSGPCRYVIVHLIKWEWDLWRVAVVLEVGNSEVSGGTAPGDGLAIPTRNVGRTSPTRSEVEQHHLGCDVIPCSSSKHIMHNNAAEVGAGNDVTASQQSWPNSRSVSFFRLSELEWRPEEASPHPLTLPTRKSETPTSKYNWNAT